MLTVIPAILLFFAGHAFGFNGHVVTEGPLKVTVVEIESPTKYDQPCDVGITLNNTGPSKLSVNLRIAGLIDQWRPVGQTQKRVELTAGGSAKTVSPTVQAIK